MLKKFLVQSVCVGSQLMYTKQHKESLQHITAPKHAKAPLPEINQDKFR